MAVAALPLAALAVPTAAALLLLLLSAAPAARAAQRKACQSPGAHMDDYYRGCKPLPSHQTLFGNLAAGAYHRYHWRLTDYSLIDKPDAERPKITFVATPCAGTAHLFVNTVPRDSGSPWPSAASYRWNASAAVSVNSINTDLMYADYYVSVFGATNTNYTLLAHTTPRVLPRPSYPDLTAVQTSQFGITVSWTTLAPGATDGAGAAVGAEYQVFYVKHPKDPPGSAEVTGRCGAEGDPNACIMTSTCGMLRNGLVADSGGYERFADNTTVSKEVHNLELDVQYFFNVAVRAATGGEKSWVYGAYAGTVGTPKYERVESAADPGTTTIIAATAGGVFGLLMLCIVLAKRKLNRAYRLKPDGQGGAAMPAGKKKKKGEEDDDEDEDGKADKKGKKKKKKKKEKKKASGKDIARRGSKKGTGAVGVSG